MAKKEWGAKHVCPDCFAKFYDLLQSPAKCPKCGKQISIRLDEWAKQPAEDDEEQMPNETEVVIGQGDDTEVSIDDENVLDEGDDDTVTLDDISDIPEEDED